MMTFHNTIRHIVAIMEDFKAIKTTPMDKERIYSHPEEIDHYFDELKTYVDDVQQNLISTSMNVVTSLS